MELTSFTISDIDLFKKKALKWADSFSVCCALDSNNNINDKYSRYEFLLAVDSLSIFTEEKNVFEKLEKFHTEKKSWLFGYMSYDLKNEVENLQSTNQDYLDFPASCFFEPRYLLYIQGNKLSINRNYPEALALYDLICNVLIDEKTETNSTIQLKSRIAKKDYLQKIATIKNHILEGDIYEMNFCRELYNEDATINPLNTFFELNEKSKAPFSSFFKINEHYILCASPERFLQKNEDLLISQPIKGTAKRGASQEEDEFLKSELYHSEKERAENIMIVDLVRNDLTHFAKTGSIQVKELFGIYTFNTVHHMISTIVATLSDSKNYISAVKKAFPMGSMTGAPKIKSMQLIEQYEQSKRGVFSGSIGYFTPENNFDFNVVIRTILYNKKNKYLSVQSGGAITIDSLPEAEWDELQLKSALIENILNKK